MKWDAHRRIKQPNWSTKIICRCGHSFASKCEWAFHVLRALDIFDEVDA